MTDNFSNPDTQGQSLSWTRIMGLAMAMSVHAAAFMLMMVPVMPPQAEEEAEEIVEVTFIEPPPPPPHAIANRAEPTFALLRYSLGGDRPSQTTHQTVSPTPLRGVG